MKSISEIRTEFEACRGSRAELYEMYAYDTRMGVQKLIQKYQKQDEKLANERLRLKQMRPYEEKYSHCDYICGIDEVGRGPLAGPVVAAAVILPKDAEILYLNDSKKLSAKRREELYDEIQEKAIAIGLALAMKPALLVADEPTTAIDAITQAEILKEFQRIKEESHTAMIFISHDLGAVSKIADEIVVMNGGKLVEQGDFEHILRHAKDPYTRMLAETRRSVMERYRLCLDNQEELCLN